jgi:probable HAF family extracellular repeat protein
MRIRVGADPDAAGAPGVEPGAVIESVLGRSACLAGALLLAATVGAAPEARTAAARTCTGIAPVSGLPGWPGGTAEAVSGSGSIAGIRPGVGSWRLFVWKAGAATDLGALRGKSEDRNAFAAAVNDRGDVVGQRETAAGEWHAFLRRGGRTVDLGTLPGGRESAAVDVGERGEIVGWSDAASGGRHLVLWQGGRMRDLGSLHAKGLIPAAIGDDGEVVGSRWVGDDSRAFRWKDGKTTDLGTLRGGEQSAAVGVDRRGRIAGWSDDASGLRHVVMWQNGEIRDLGTLGRGGYGTATAMNDAGEIVGSGETAADPSVSVEHAFLWRDGTLTDLGTLRGDLESEATGITDGGLVLGRSVHARGGRVPRQVLWTPGSSSAECSLTVPSDAADTVAVGAGSITVRGSVEELKADAGRAIVRVRPPDSAVCSDVFVWGPPRRVTTVVDSRRCSELVPLESTYGVALAGGEAAYIGTGGGNILESSVNETALSTRRSRRLAWETADGQGAYGEVLSNLHGDGSLLVFGDHTRCVDSEAARNESCPPGVEEGTVVSSRIRLALPARRVIAASSYEIRLLAVGGGRVVVRTGAGDLLVLAPRAARAPRRVVDGVSAERLVATYAYRPREALAAATDGRTLAVLRSGALDVIQLTGARGTRRTWRLPSAANYGADLPVACSDWGKCHVPVLRLADLDGDLAVFVRGNGVYGLRLATGRITLLARPAGRPVSAQLEPGGLYVAAGSTVTFTPRAEVERRAR